MMTFKGREANVPLSTFNMQWRLIMTKLIQMLEILLHARQIWSLTIDVLVDDLSNMWLLDAYNCGMEAKIKIENAEKKPKPLGKEVTIF